MAWIKHLVFTTSLAIAVSACEQTSNENPAPEMHFTQAQSAVIAQAMAGEFRSAITKLYQAQLNFSNTIQTLLNNPNESHLIAAQNALQNTLSTTRKVALLTTLAHTAPTLFEDTHLLLNRLVQFPILPGFIDSYGSYEFSGLVNDISLPITPGTLAEQHGVTDSGEVILGYYAMEYLLFSDQNSRKPDDFVAVNNLSAEQQALGLQSIDEIPNNRRGQLLKLQTELASADIDQLVQAWSEAKNPLKAWNKLSPDATFELVSRAVNQTITQLMIEIVELNQASDSPYEGLISPAVFTMEHSQKVNWLENGINGLTPVWEYYPEEIRNSIQEKIGKLTQALEQLKQENKKENWEATYASAKALADAVRE